MAREKGKPAQNSHGQPISASLSLRFTNDCCLVAEQHFQMPQVLGRFSEDFRGRVAVVGGGCCGEPVEQGD
jgi:hypothetical protein